jgi:hypothetical protein
MRTTLLDTQVNLHHNNQAPTAKNNADFGSIVDIEIQSSTFAGLLGSGAAEKYRKNRSKLIMDYPGPA